MLDTYLPCVLGEYRSISLSPEPTCSTSSARLTELSEMSVELALNSGVVSAT